MLADSEAPRTLWVEAANTAAYLLNRSPASSIGQTPYEAWHGHQPDLSGLKVFGCVAFAHTPKIPSRKKLDSRSTRCVFLGYEGKHQYRVYEPISRKVLRVRDVIFDERTPLEHRREIVTARIDGVMTSIDAAIEHNAPAGPQGPELG